MTTMAPRKKENGQVTYVRMTPSTRRQVGLLCSLHNESIKELIARLVKEDFKEAQQSGTLSDYLASLAGLEE